MTMSNCKGGAEPCCCGKVYGFAFALLVVVVAKTTKKNAFTFVFKKRALNSQKLRIVFV